MNLIKANWRNFLLLGLLAYMSMNLLYQSLHWKALNEVAEELCLRSGASGYTISPGGTIYCVREAEKQLVKLN